ncbi:UNVERIFIED_CONTAM: hypothetical protein Sradi_6553000 [Sesamum radiatum]|uniref:Uncharacterized protein n=1 Tax=Sesamum radiatum TaxID=300843 RepID=A0AAW2JX28_SESRA
MAILAQMVKQAVGSLVTPLDVDSPEEGKRTGCGWLGPTFTSSIGSTSPVAHSLGVPAESL